jgi:predicted ATPase
VLAASTERLHLREEWVYDLRGLALPPPPDATAQHDRPDYTSFGAVQLFLQNARRTNTYFVVTPESLDWVVEICRLVDGIPLALELASSLTRHMSLAEIAQGIEDGLDLLETSLRNVPARHRSMATVFADMWRRLDESERRVLCSLTVFPGSCTRAAIEAVTGASTALVNSLVDKSLVYYSGGGRIAMHRLLRRYVMGRMQTAAGELAEARDRHCRYYAALLHQHVQESTRANRREVQLPLEEEMDNLRAALRHARSSHELRAIAEEIEKYCIIPVYES